MIFLSQTLLFVILLNLSFSTAQRLNTIGENRDDLSKIGYFILPYPALFALDRSGRPIVTTEKRNVQFLPSIDNSPVNNALERGLSADQTPIDSIPILANTEISTSPQTILNSINAEENRMNHDNPESEKLPIKKEKSEKKLIELQVTGDDNESYRPPHSEDEDSKYGNDLQHLQKEFLSPDKQKIITESLNKIVRLKENYPEDPNYSKTNFATMSTSNAQSVRELLHVEATTAPTADDFQLPSSEIRKSLPIRRRQGFKNMNFRRSDPRHFDNYDNFLNNPDQFGNRQYRNQYPRGFRPVQNEGRYPDLRTVLDNRGLVRRFPFYQIEALEIEFP